MPSTDHIARTYANSLARSRARRCEPRTGLMPHGREWKTVLALVALGVLALALLVLLWAVM